MSETTTQMLARRGRILLPIRARLASWYTLLLAFVLVLFSILVYTTLTSNLVMQVDRSLEDQAAVVARQIRPDFLVQGRYRVPPSSDLSVSDVLVQIAKTDGSIVTTSDNLGGATLPVGAGALDVATGGGPRYETITLAGQRVRLYDAPLLSDGKLIGIVQVARVLKPIDDTASGLRLLLAVGSLLALIAALGMGWLISGQALRPLDRVSRTAEQIGQERDFGRRVPYSGPHDEVGRLAATFNTMLDRLQGAYADAQDAARRLESALTVQQRFVGDASHELRTPLTAIRGNAELLQRVPDMDVEDRQASIAEIAGQAQRMSRLVSDLLELARADAGQHVRREPVAVPRLVREAVAEARHLPGGAALSLVEPLPEVSILGDSDYLKQLLLILLDNARKYTPAQGQVAVGSMVQEGQLVISVSDSGCGIDPADLPHIFERFYRADRARVAGGTGLGLSIAGWIVREHGGQIRVESAPGAGSTFHVVLPLCTEVAEVLI
ncbi:MAG TPA: HAMP domain-containing sensor histidine kinase [Chloroflexia bacterium]|nr:HAMP domain-containing sensor histidine kinase [Chloroflexia bacterium]